MNPQICQAIGDRAVIRFMYDNRLRVVEPHAHGTSTAGNEVLRGYQITGESSSRTPPFWSLFSASRITGLTLTGDTFDTNGPDYNPHDSAMAPVHCHV